MFSAIERKSLLRARLLDLLRDDEEYLEELYLGCNFDLESLFDSPSGCQLLSERFRLSELVVELAQLCDLGFVEWRVDHSWAEAAQITRCLYRLTNLGIQQWMSTVPVLGADLLYQKR